jgi:polysaccharide export outer membrane protein
MRYLIVVLVLVACAGPSSFQTQLKAPSPGGASAPRPEASVPAPAADLAMLRPGDVVRINVWRKEELTGEFQIAADGTIRHPYYREVQVVGVPLEVAEERVRSFLERYEANPLFVMEPMFHVAVSGEVRQPRLYALSPEMTITQAIAMAGGPTERGRADRVVLLRDGRRMEIDLNRPESAEAQIPVRSGDQITVERRTIVREYVAPVASVAGAAAAILNIILRYR